MATLAKKRIKRYNMWCWTKEAKQWILASLLL